MSSRLEKLLSIVHENKADDFTLFAIAMEYVKSNQLQLAIDYFEKLKHQNPNYTGLYYHLSNLYFSTGEHNLAKTTIEMGLERCNALKSENDGRELKSLFLELFD